MKRALLFSLLIACATVFAQNQRNLEPQLAPHKSLARQIVDPTNVPTKPYVIPSVKSPQQVAISSSANVYGSLVEKSTCLTANQDLNTIMFTSRANPSAGIGTSSGNIVNSISSNFGQTWSNIFATTDSRGNRYPSGVIYNPAANTDPANAFSVVCGPTTDGSGWLDNFWGSIGLDGANQSVVYESYSVFPQDFPRYGMSAPGSGKVHVLGSKYVTTTGVGTTTWDYLIMNNGTFNSTTKAFDWNRVKIFNAFANVASVPAFEISDYTTTWSPDGSVGYIVVMGIDSTNSNTSYQPTVFKSVDMGASWTKMPFYNFANDTTIYNRIWATLADDQVKRPFFSEFGLTVDNNGNLHMTAMVKGAYSTHPDSLGYTFKYEPGELYHIYTTTTGWASEHVTTILTRYVPAAESGYGSGTDAAGWDHRIQMSRTADGTKIFALWTDSDTLYYETVVAPNLNAWGKNLTTNTVYPIQDFTTGTMLDGTILFHYVSDIALMKGSDVVIPVSFASLGATPADPVSHYYLTSVGYGPTIGINPIDNTAKLSLVGCFPNPASDVSEIRINLGQSSATSVDVYNLTGQKVATANFGSLTAGQHKLALDVQNLNSGVYVYVVTAGSQTVSGKMVRQ